jgi:hypothetical protein
MGVVQAPLAIVWGSALSVAEYMAKGREVEVPEQACPDCEVRLRPWGRYERTLRGYEGAIWIRRGRCPECGRTHALLPDFVHARRLYEVEVIGAAIERTAARVGAWRSSVELEVPFSTLRDWRVRCRQRALLLLASLAEHAGKVGAVLGELPTRAVAAMLALLEMVWRWCRERRPEATGGRWRFWNAVCGGWALGRNTSPV